MRNKCEVLNYSSNFAENCDECPLNQGLLLGIEVIGRTVGTFRIVCYMILCPLLRGVC